MWEWVPSAVQSLFAQSLALCFSLRTQTPLIRQHFHFTCEEINPIICCVWNSVPSASPELPQGPAGLGFAALTSLIPPLGIPSAPSSPRNSRMQFPTAKHRSSTSALGVYLWILEMHSPCTPSSRAGMGGIPAPVLWVFAGVPTGLTCDR